MKKTLLLTLTILFVHHAFSQETKQIISAADSAIKMYTWDIERSVKGSMMFLDVPFKRENYNSIEYLTLTVAKDKTKKRPDFISIIIPNNIVQSNGIIMTFAKDSITNNRRDIIIDKNCTIRLRFEKCNSKDCTARIIDCFATQEDSNEKLDILKLFLNYDHVLFLLLYPDKSHKSLMVPLFSFKQQFNNL
jgi:hypothetical protein